MSIRKGFVIDLTNLTVFGECQYDDKIIDGMFINITSGFGAGKGPYPAAIVFPIENLEPVVKAMDYLKTIKKTYEDATAEMYYKIFPKLR